MSVEPQKAAVHVPNKSRLRTDVLLVVGGAALGALLTGLVQFSFDRRADLREDAQRAIDHAFDNLIIVQDELEEPVASGSTTQSMPALNQAADALEAARNAYTDGDFAVAIDHAQQANIILIDYGELRGRVMNVGLGGAPPRVLPSQMWERELVFRDLIHATGDE